MWEPLKSFLAHEHTFFAHFPIALISIGAAMRIFWALRPGAFRWDSSQAMLAIGAISTFVSVASGLSRVNFDWQLHGTLSVHRNAAMALGLWAALHLLLLWVRPAWMQTRLGAALWAILGAVLALATGYYGSEVAEGS